MMSMSRSPLWSSTTWGVRLLRALCVLAYAVAMSRAQGNDPISEVNCGQPDSQQVSLPFGVGPIPVLRPPVQGHRILEPFDVAALTQCSRSKNQMRRRKRITETEPISERSPSRHFHSPCARAESSSKNLHRSVAPGVAALRTLDKQRPPASSCRLVV